MPTVPKGFTTVFPYLLVEDAKAYLDYLRDGLGGEIIAVNQDSDGTLANGQVRFGDTTLMVSEARGEWHATRGTYYLYVDNACKAMQKAVETGGKVVMPVNDMPYGDRQGGVEDIRGNTWWLSQHMTQDGQYK